MPTQIFFGDFPEGVLIPDRVPQPEIHAEAPEACVENPPVSPSISPPSQGSPTSTNYDPVPSTFNAILAQQNPFVDNVLRLEFTIGMTTLQNYLLATIKRMDLSEDPLQSFFNMANDFFASYHITLVCVRINQLNPHILELHFISSADRWKADDLAMVFGDFCLHGNIRRWEDYRTLVIRDVPAIASLVGEPDGRHDFREGFNGWVALKTEHVEELGKMNLLDDGREYRIREVLCYHNSRGPAVQSQMNMWVVTFSDADCAARFLGKGKFNFFGYMDGFVSYWVPKKERHGGDRRKTPFKPPQWINGEWVKVHQVGVKIEETGNLEKVEEKGKEKTGQVEVPFPNGAPVRYSSRGLGQHQIQEKAKTVRAKEKADQVGAKIKKAEDVKERVKADQVGANIKKAEDAKVEAKEETGQGEVGTKITKSSKGKVDGGAGQSKAKTEAEGGDLGTCKQRKKFRWQAIKAKRREGKKIEGKIEEKVEEKVAQVGANTGGSARSVMGEVQRNTGGKVEGEAGMRVEEKAKDKAGETEVKIGENLRDAGEEVGEKMGRMKEKANQAKTEVEKGVGNVEKVEEKPREKEGKETKGKVDEIAVKVEGEMGNTEDKAKGKVGKVEEEVEENGAGKVKKRERERLEMPTPGCM